MTLGANDLYRRIMAFDFDEPAATLTFQMRLARQNGWSQAFARRVIDEYKRFAFLAVVAEHAVAPSDAVDEAWHLHLTYTRSYWRRFCVLLGRPLHHHPTRGGAAELNKHTDWYERTLASYRSHFGHAPPSDIWPVASQRFHVGRGHRRVDLDANWVIPKPRLPRLDYLAVAAAGLAPVVGLAINPFNFDGPHFLLLYAIVFVLALISALLLRRSLRVSDRLPTNEKLSPFEAAYLAGGKPLAIRAALAALVYDGVLEVRRDKTKVLGLIPTTKEYRIASCQSLPDGATALERTVYEAAVGEGQNIPKLHAAADAEAARFAERLQHEGLVLDDAQAARARWWPAMLMASVACLGAIKIVVGLSRHRPVAFLVFGVFATLVVAAIFLMRAFRSRAGDDLLKRLRAEHAKLNIPARGGPRALMSTELPLAMALFGSTVLIGGPLDDLRLAFAAPVSQGGGGGAGCGSGCGGGGCGGGGCGGCGGGCGGCGD